MHVLPSTSLYYFNMMNIASRPGVILSFVAKRFFIKSTRPWKDRIRPELNRYKGRRLNLALRVNSKPDQFVRPQYEPDPVVKTIERKLLPLNKMRLPYKEYTQEEQDRLEKYGTFYDPHFNPHLYDERHKVDPNEEPFNEIYNDNEAANRDESKSDQYTGVRNITSPELWKYVEDLERIKVNPEVKRRKVGEPIEPLPSGWIPPAEQPPDLPYFVARTRNHLLPVYYQLHSNPDECVTILKRISGDLWTLEEELRCHLESLLGNKRRILTSVQEPDGRIFFRGRYLHEVVDWLHQKGF